MLMKVKNYLIYSTPATLDMIDEENGAFTSREKQMTNKVTMVQKSTTRPSRNRRVPKYLADYDCPGAPRDRSHLPMASSQKGVHHSQRFKYTQKDTRNICDTQDRENVIDYPDAFKLRTFILGLDKNNYGDIVKEYEALHAQKMALLNLLSGLKSGPPFANLGVKSSQANFERSDQINHHDQEIRKQDFKIIDLEVVCGEEQQDAPPSSEGSRVSHGVKSYRACFELHDQFNQQIQVDPKQEQNFSLGRSFLRSSIRREKKSREDIHNKIKGDAECSLSSPIENDAIGSNGDATESSLGQSMKMQDSSQGVESYNEDDGAEIPGIDGLDDLWRDMSIVVDCSKITSSSDGSAVVQVHKGEECDHAYILREEYGIVCRVCGVIQQPIATIFFEGSTHKKLVGVRPGPRSAYCDNY